MSGPRSVPWLLRRAAERCYLDLGPAGATTFVAGMGRSGTTWVADILNHDYSYRILFEPLLSARVRATGGFAYIQYMDRGDQDPIRVHAMERILSGRVRARGVDRNHRGVIFWRRIVKEVRCNLMLGWLRQIRPTMPIVLVVRHPLALAASWLRLGWGATTASPQPDLEIILSQNPLLEAFPVIRSAMTQIDRADAFERIILQWCIQHVVPLRQLGPGEMLLLPYEDLVLTPDAAIDRLAAYLGTPIDPAGRARVSGAFGITNLLGRDPAAPRTALVTDWRERITPTQIQRARDLLSRFELHDRYDADW